MYMPNSIAGAVLHSDKYEDAILNLSAPNAIRLKMMIIEIIAERVCNTYESAYNYIKNSI